MTVDEERLEAWLSRYADMSGTPLSEGQVEAVRKAVSSRVFVLTGGPGVGKTTTANTIIRLFRAMGKTVALAAPTGRAAQRLTEVAAVQAKTLHRLLEWTPKIHGFLRDEHNPIVAQAIIVDESSMLDIRLADALIRATPPSAQLVLIGDVDQLPSVGPGNVLHDLIDSGCVPFTRLTQIFRQAATSHIVQAAHAINRGQSPEFGQVLKTPLLSTTTDCQFVEADTPEACKAAMKHLIHRELPERFGLNPLTDVQVLTPMNRGDLGTQTLNLDFQELLNPKQQGQSEFKRGAFTLRAGDKVIQSVNNYDLGVFNGDIGYVQHTEVEGGKLIVAFGDRTVNYEGEDGLDLRLAYAITIHKSQGSEFPAVIIPVSTQHYIMLQKNLIYTALTRARRLAIFVGTPKALSFAVRNQNKQSSPGNPTGGRRQTLLIDRLRQACRSGEE